MPVEGRGLSSRPTQDAVRDLEIGRPSNSEKCSETADGVTRESEGGSRLSLLRSVRQSMDASRRKVILLGPAVRDACIYPACSWSASAPGPRTEAAHHRGP